MQAASLWAVISLKSKIEVSVKDRIQAIKGSHRTFLCPCHTSGDDLPFPDVLSAAIFDMAFRPGDSLDVNPRRVQVTVSQARGDHILLRCVSESNGSAALHSHLRHGQ